METKPLLYGLIGFFVGGFIVSVAAVTFDKPSQSADNNHSMTDSMHVSAANLQKLTGDDFDAAFMADMIAHHQGAIDMTRLAATNAKHDEIKQLSQAIVSAQEKEIQSMHQWQHDWGYQDSSHGHSDMERSKEGQ